MTKAEAIRQLQRQVSWPLGERASIETISMAIAALVKENEPAPSANDTSSGTQNKFLQDNDNTDLQKCQEVIKEARKRLLAIYEILSDEGRIAFELGELYHLLEGRSEESDEDA